MESKRFESSASEQLERRRLLRKLPLSLPEPSPFSAWPLGDRARRVVRPLGACWSQPELASGGRADDDEWPPLKSWSSLSLIRMPAKSPSDKQDFIAVCSLVWLGLLLPGCGCCCCCDLSAEAAGQVTGSPLFRVRRCFGVSASVCVRPEAAEVGGIGVVRGASE